MSRAKVEIEPETRVGICCGCQEGNMPLYKVTGLSRYRCAECYEVETGYRHYLSPPKEQTQGVPLRQREQKALPLTDDILLLLKSADLIAGELNGLRLGNVYALYDRDLIYWRAGNSENYTTQQGTFPIYDHVKLTPVGLAIAHRQQPTIKE